jgi:hypothetical protein
LSRRRPHDASSVAPVAFPPCGAAPVLHSVGTPRSSGSFVTSDAMTYALPLPFISGATLATRKHTPITAGATLASAAAIPCREATVAAAASREAVGWHAIGLRVVSRQLTAAVLPKPRRWFGSEGRRRWRKTQGGRLAKSRAWVFDGRHDRTLYRDPTTKNIRLDEGPESIYSIL